MASQPMLKTEAAHARRMADAAKAIEVAERFDGWHVFSSNRAAGATANPSPLPWRPNFHQVTENTYFFCCKQIFAFSSPIFDQLSLGQFFEILPSAPS